MSTGKKKKGRTMKIKGTKGYSLDGNGDDYRMYRKIRKPMPKPTRVMDNSKKGRVQRWQDLMEDDD